MNLRDRAWRARMARVLSLLDQHLETADLDWEAHAHLRVLRERLAGALGAEEGWTSTPELRERAAADYAEAVKVLGLDEAPLTPPKGDPPEGVVTRGFDSFRRESPKRGDRT